jgi:small subunit ribosomal protein S20
MRPVVIGPEAAWSGPPQSGTPNLLPTASLSAKFALMGVNSEPKVRRAGSGTIAAPARCGRFLQMPNIKQQKKRVRTSAEDRLDNLRYRSTVKTVTRRLEAAVEAGDKEQIAAEHTALQRWIDRAAAHGALHKNTAARKKAQAARLVAGRS